MTPIRVRGKRSAPASEKWDARKQRRTTHSPALNVSGEMFEVQQAYLQKRESLRKRMVKERTLSYLEQLPTEIIQAIFVFSGNVDLALTSRTIKARLNRRGLCENVTTGALYPVLEAVDGPPPPPEHLRDVVRLLDSRFLTWNFLNYWGEKRVEQIGSMLVTFAKRFEYDPKWSLCPALSSLGIWPPCRLFQGPFSQDLDKPIATFPGQYRDPWSIMYPWNVDFIRALIFHRPSTDPGAAYQEKLREAVEHAVRAQHSHLLEILLKIWPVVDTDLLRMAVVEAGCEELSVKEILSHKDLIDTLDTQVWSWAESARSCGNEKGQWLMDMLVAAEDGTLETRYKEWRHKKQAEEFMEAMKQKAEEKQKAKQKAKAACEALGMPWESDKSDDDLRWRPSDSDDEDP